MNMNSKIALIAACLTGLLSMNSHAAESVDVTFNITVTAGTCDMTASPNIINFGTVYPGTPAVWKSIVTPQQLQIIATCKGSSSSVSSGPKITLTPTTGTFAATGNSGSKLFRASSTTGYGFGVYKKSAASALGDTTSTDLWTNATSVSLGTATSWSALSQTLDYSVGVFCVVSAANTSNCGTLGTGALDAKLTFTFSYN